MKFGWNENALDSPIHDIESVVPGIRIHRNRSRTDSKSLLLDGEVCLSPVLRDRSVCSLVPNYFLNFGKGPKYVLLYGVLLSAIIGLVRQFSSIQALGTSIIKLCATKEQQERCLGSLSIDSNSIKQKTE